MAPTFAQPCQSDKQRPLRFQDNRQAISDKVGLVPSPEVRKRSR